MSHVVAQADSLKLSSTRLARFGNDVVDCFNFGKSLCCDLEEHKICPRLQIELGADRAFHIISSVATNDVVFLVVLVEPELEVKVILTFEPPEISVVKLFSSDHVLEEGSTYL
jgi:hypothetical protein